jgi:hypothetical protein
MADPAWMLRAGCRDAAPHIGALFHSSERPAQEIAKLMCSACGVRADCLEYATRHNLLGIWGGITDNERRRIRTSDQRHGLDTARPLRSAPPALLNDC